MTETASLDQACARHIRFADGSAQWVPGYLPMTAVNAQPLPEGGVECIAQAPAFMVNNWERRVGAFEQARLNPLVPLAKGFIARAEAQGMKGKARDRAAMEFFLGAASALRFAGRDEDAGHVILCAAMVLCSRGYSEVERWATLPAYLGTTKQEG